MGVTSERKMMMKVILTLAAAAVVLGAPQYEYDDYADYRSKNTQPDAPAPAPVVPAEYRQQPVLAEEEVENRLGKRSAIDLRISDTLGEDIEEARYLEYDEDTKVKHDEKMEMLDPREDDLEKMVDE